MGAAAGLGSPAFRSHFALPLPDVHVVSVRGFGSEQVAPRGKTQLEARIGRVGVWLGRYQQQLIEYQREEIQLLRQKLGGRRLPLQRWESATAGGVGEEDRTQGSWSGCHGGDAGYDPTLVPRNGGEEVRWQRQTRAGATGHRYRRSSACWCAWPWRTRVGATRDCVARSRT
jgi:hypothetical protein